MEISTIQGEVRQPGGRHANERLRRRGLVPAVIYGHKQPPQTVALSLHDTVLALSHMTRIIRLKINGREEQYLIKDVQYDHLHKTPIHVDLMRVDVSERVRVRVPVELRGTPKGALEGGTLVQVLAELEIECRPLEIPEVLKARVDHLGLNETLHVREIAVPPEIKVHHAPDDIVAVVHPPRGTTTEAAAVAEGEEGPAEPEVISKGKEESEGEGGES